MPFRGGGVHTIALGCDFNRSMQHLHSHYREEDVENEVSEENLLHRNRQGIDVGSLGESKMNGCSTKLTV